MSAQLVLGSANALSGSLKIGPRSVSLGPVGQAYGSAPPGFNHSHTVHTYDQAYALDPADPNQPTLNVAAANVVTDATSAGLGIDAVGTSATSDIASANFLLTDYPRFKLGVLGLSISGTLIHAESDASYIFGPDRGFLEGTASFGSLVIGGGLIGKTLTFAGIAAANTILYHSPTVTITLDKQTLSDFLPPGPGQPVGPVMRPGGAAAVAPSTNAHNRITTDAIDIHFNQAAAFGRTISGDIAVGVTSASLFPPLHAG